jgi:hypothetical protein
MGRVSHNGGHRSVPGVLSAMWGKGREGATGYVIKSDAGGELISAVEAVFQGKRFVSRRLEGRISADAEDPQAPRFPWPQ